MAALQERRVRAGAGDRVAVGRRARPAGHVLARRAARDGGVEALRRPFALVDAVANGPDGIDDLEADALLLGPRGELEEAHELARARQVRLIPLGRALTAVRAARRRAVAEVAALAGILGVLLLVGPVAVVVVPADSCPLGGKPGRLPRVGVGVLVVAVRVVEDPGSRRRRVAAAHHRQAVRDGPVLVAVPVAVGVLVIEHAAAAVAAVERALARALEARLRARGARDRVAGRVAAHRVDAEAALALAADHALDGEAELGLAALTVAVARRAAIGGLRAARHACALDVRTAGVPLLALAGVSAARAAIEAAAALAVAREARDRRRRGAELRAAARGGVWEGARALAVARARAHVLGDDDAA